MTAAAAAKAGASCLRAGCPRAQGRVGAAEAKARKGNAPRRKKPRRARESHVEKSGGGNLNRQRDQTPEARPLWQQCLCAESALGTIHPRGTAIRGRFDELVFATANLGGAPAKAGLVSAEAVGKPIA